MRIPDGYRRQYRKARCVARCARGALTFTHGTSARIIPLDALVGPRATNAFIQLAVRRSSPMYEHVEIVRRSVEFERLHPLSRLVSAERVQAVERYITLARAQSIPLFEPVCLRHPGERRYHIALPPVVEPCPEGYAIIDGVHRLRVLSGERASHVKVVSLTGVNLPPLPAQPGSWLEVGVQSKSVAQRRKFKGWKRQLFRPTASYFRSEAFAFATLTDVMAACNEAVELSQAPVGAFWCRTHARLDDCSALKVEGGSMRRHLGAAAGH
jgi:hypothetical protein